MRNAVTQSMQWCVAPCLFLPLLSWDFWSILVVYSLQLETLRLTKFPQNKLFRKSSDVRNPKPIGLSCHGNETRAVVDREVQLGGTQLKEQCYRIHINKNCINKYTTNGQIHIISHTHKKEVIWVTLILPAMGYKWVNPWCTGNIHSFCDCPIPTHQILRFLC